VWGSLGVIQQAVGGLGRIGPAYQTSPTYQLRVSEFLLIVFLYKYVSTVYSYWICTNTGYGPILAYWGNLGHHHNIS
jgi:hypothetical protein